MATITLLHHTPLSVCSTAVRTCWQSHDRSDNGGPKDLALIDKVGNKYKHASTLEHLNYNFYVEDVSRALLQELVRHRIASPSVKSTRYTLKELKEIANIDPEDMATVSRFCVLIPDRVPGSERVNTAIALALMNLQDLVKQGLPNDITKFALPDAYKTELTWTINARSLQNFFALRTASSALWEIRRMASAVFNALPADHKYLFTGQIEETDHGL